MKYSQNVSKLYIFQLSVPIFFANIAIPTVGFVDTALMGHLSSEKFLAALSIATSVLTMIIGSLGFLRMATVGVVSQSLGKGDYKEISRTIIRNLLLALMGIETNFGTYLGKMDIVSSLATLSFDKRRSKFFTEELITLLKLVDANIIDPKTLFGSWAGAFGNFQFMPSTITNHAIDYNNDNKIDLKNIEDSFASAANYIRNLGWNNNIPCFYKINLKNNIPIKYLNTSAKKLKNKEKVKVFTKYISNNEFLEKYHDLNSAIITPDVDIVENAKKLSPAYIVFDNYELILKWNRSLRFALAVCTLKNKFKNEL
mgnify:CR=1 FL=1